MKRNNRKGEEFLMTRRIHQPFKIAFLTLLALLLGAGPSFGQNAANSSQPAKEAGQDRGFLQKSTRLNSSHDQISYAVFCLKKKTKKPTSSLPPLHAYHPLDTT